MKAEFEDGKFAFKLEQKRLRNNLVLAFNQYFNFHVKGFDKWFKEWKTRRRVK